MSKNKSKTKEKIFFLIDFAISESKRNKLNPYIFDYIKIAFDLAKKINYRIPAIIHRKICKNCFAIRNLDNTKIRSETRKVNGNLNKYLKIHCLSCGSIKKINLGKINKSKPI